MSAHKAVAHRMTAHELAESLLAQPDLPVEVLDDYFAAPLTVLSVYDDEDAVVIDIGLPE